MPSALDAINAASTSNNNAVYWVGTDNNIYFKSGDSVKNAGKALGVSDVGFDGQLFSGEARRIADPNPQPQASASAPANPNGGGGSSGPVAADKSNSIALQLAGLGAVDQQYSSGIAAIDKALSGLYSQYDTETGRNEGTYSEQSDVNQNNLQKNKQTALVNAAQGRRGLFGALSSIGALNGSGIDLANGVVRKGANQDLSGAADSYGVNQSGLDTAITGYRDEDARRRKEAETAATNAKTNARAQAAESRQKFYTNLANDYSAQLDPANAKKYTDLAASLFPEIAGANIPNSNIAYSGAVFTPNTLQNYIAGADSTQVTATPRTGGEVPGLFATSTKKKKTTST